MNSVHGLPGAFHMNAILQKNLFSLQKYHPSIYSSIEAQIHTQTTSILVEHTNPIQHSSILDDLEQGMDFFYSIGLSPTIAFKSAVEEVTKENRGVLIIEPTVSHFIHSMNTIDITDYFKNPRLFLVVGESWKDQLITIWDQTHCYAAAQPVIYNTFQNLQNIEVWIKQQITSRHKILNEQIQNLPRTLQQLPKNPIRIWCFEDLRGKQKYSTIQHALIRTLFHHWQEMGCEVEYLRFVDGEYYPPYYRIIKLAAFKPNVIFLCNKSPAYEFALGAELSRSLPIPKIVWHADDPVYGEHLLERYKVTSDESHWVADYGWQKTLENYGAKNVQYLPGACTKSWKGKKLSRHNCDIVFVGQVRDQSEFFQSLSPGWRHYAEKVIAEKLRFPRKDVNEVLNQFTKPEAIPLDLFDEIKQKILWEANTRFRLQMMKGLLDFDLRIYGNPAWLKWLPPDIAKRCFHGVVHYKRLFDVYRNAKITLNIHSLQTYTCMNVRDFDVPVSGGFLVSDWLPRAEEIFQPGFVSDLPLNDKSDAQVFFYRSIPELQKITRYFLENEDQRLDCIERARQHVVQHHTYKHRAQILFNNMIELGKRDE